MYLFQNNIVISFWRPVIYKIFVNLSHPYFVYKLDFFCSFDRFIVWYKFIETWRYQKSLKEWCGTGSDHNLILPPWLHLLMQIIIWTVRSFIDTQVKVNDITQNNDSVYFKHTHTSLSDMQISLQILCNVFFLIFCLTIGLCPLNWNYTQSSLPNMSTIK